MAKSLKANGVTETDDQPKKRGRKKAAPPPSNVTDETIQQFYDKALAAKIDLEKCVEDQKAANGVYRQILKDAKKAGVAPDDIVWRLNQRNRTPEEIDAETRRRNRIAALTNLPIGGQLGLFEDGESVATKIETGAVAPAEGNGDAGGFEEMKAYEKGYQAGRQGKNADKCPFQKGSKDAREWERGRGVAMKDMIEENAAAGNGAPPIPPEFDRRKKKSAEATA